MMVRKHGCGRQKQKTLEMPWRGRQPGGSRIFTGQAAESAGRLRLMRDPCSKVRQMVPEEHTAAPLESVRHGSSSETLS